jgi:hypothetical protein
MQSGLFLHKLMLQEHARKMGCGNGKVSTLGFGRLVWRIERAKW